MTASPPPDNAYWLQRWCSGRTGWHRDEVMPLLRTHWPALVPRPGERVLVPLCGKSVDMGWLQARGHPVLGVELSPLAIEAFLTEHGLHAQARDMPGGVLHQSGTLSILQADMLQVDAAAFAGCTLMYDRAALIALAPAQRQRYVQHVHAALPIGTRGLLITLEYPQPQKHGPPFAVHEGEVRRLLEPGWQVEVLERRDILSDEPGFAAEGVTALHTVVYALRKWAGTPEHPL